ncbi:hypothetical protein [Cetobacterium sp.]|uniref:hypothetical protein n=1 Tax=Cetobacterium sp. TaxID=2071632 RepID=UPI002FC87047
MEKYLIINARDTSNKKRYLMFWYHDGKGYTTNLEEAGKYDKDKTLEKYQYGLDVIEDKDKLRKVIRAILRGGRNRIKETDYLVKESLLREWLIVKIVVDFDNGKLC